jgi:NAD(P)-dependent dehydrogenase (short-subunit alcohol dehydrogenase family)
METFLCSNPTVTGTSSGLGRAATEHVLSHGDIVVATARNTDSLKDLTSLYPPTRLLPVSLDVLKPDDIKAAFTLAIEQFGRIDVVYSNSGIATQGEIESVPEETAHRQFDVNFWAAANVAKEAVRVFREVNQPAGGRLLIASSIAGVSGMPAMGYYCASYVQYFIW